VGDTCTTACGRAPRAYAEIQEDLRTAATVEFTEASRVPGAAAVDRLARRLLSRRLTRFQFELSGLCSTCAYVALLRLDGRKQEVANA